MANVKTGLIDLVKMYGSYLSQKNREQADLYLKKEGITGDLCEAIRACFNEQGKLIKADGSRIGTLELMGMRNFI